MSKFNTNLSEADIELLSLLVEECGEVIQVVGKMLRHGLMSCDPTKKQAPTNKQLLEKELGDVAAAQTLLESSDIVDWQAVSEHRREKLISVKQWLHFN